MIIDLFKAFLSLIKLNLIILFNKILYPKKKIIFFYQPKKNFNIKSANFIEDLFNDLGKNFLFFISFSSSNVKGYNYYYIKQSFLKWIINVDLFLSTNVCDVFTKNSTAIYMHHDIYDTPLVDTKNEKKLFQRLIKYDYFFLSNRKNIVMFQNFFNKHNSDLNLKVPKIIETGYLKLDYLKKNINSDRLINNSIVIAPTDYRLMENFSMFNDIIIIINNLLLETSFNIVFRPYPANRNAPNTLQINKIYESNKRYKFDVSENYFDVYSKSACMITDISGTAFTYAFLTKKPVIFVSKNEKLLAELGYDKLAYFKDREKVGAIVENINKIKNTIENISSIEEKIKRSNDLFEKEITYFGCSKSRIYNIIKKIVWTIEL